jgi:hypothetical protein
MQELIQLMRPAVIHIEVLANTVFNYRLGRNDFIYGKSREEGDGQERHDRAVM